MVDLRSDTVTRPTAAMLSAMAGATVGDDVLGDDPTVQELEEFGAELMGKDAGLFLPSGTMSNNVAIAALTRPGDEALLDWDAHSLRHECGAPAVLSGVVLRQYRSDTGIPRVSEIESAIQSETLHAPGTRLILLENTHNASGGTVIPLAVHRRIFDVARDADVSVHLDGARLFNAAVAAETAVVEYARFADTVTFCLSKGLGCPVGSVLTGNAETIDRARRLRKRFGGGLRQAGFLAAAGLYALRHHRDRLVDDHRRARVLAEHLAELSGIQVDLKSVQTNMVYFETTGSAKVWVDALAREGVACLALGEHRIRMVTHLDISDAGIDHAIEATRKIDRLLSSTGASQ